MMVVAVHPAVATGPLKHHDADPQPQPQPSRGATTPAASSTATSRPRETLAASVTASSASSSLLYSTTTTTSQSPPRNTNNKPSTSMVETSPPASTDEGDQQQCTFAEDAGAAIVESSPPPSSSALAEAVSSSALAEAVSRTLATRQQQAASMVVKEKAKTVTEGEAAVISASASPPRTPPPSPPPSQRCAPSSYSNHSSVVTSASSSAMSSRDTDDADGSVVGQHLIGTPPPPSGSGNGEDKEEGSSPHAQRGNMIAMSRERQLEERVARLEGTIFALVAMMRNDGGGASPSHSAMSSLLEGTPGRDLSMPHLVDAGTGRRSRTPPSGGSPSSSPSCAYDDDGTSPPPALPPPRRGGSSTSSSERRRRNSAELRARKKSPPSSSHRAALQQTPPRPPPDGRSVPVLDSPSPTPHRRKKFTFADDDATNQRGGSRRSGDRDDNDGSVSVVNSAGTTVTLLTTPSLHDSQGDIDYVPSPPSKKSSSSAARSGHGATRRRAPTVEEGDGSDDNDDDGRDHDHSSSSSDEYPSDDSPRPQEVQHLEYRSFTPDYEEELTRLRQQHRRQFRSASFNDVPMNEEEVEEEEEERRRCSESIYSSISSIGDASGIGGSGSGSGGVGAALVVNDDIVAAARKDDSAPDSEESDRQEVESAAVRPVERSAPVGDAASPSSEVIAAASASTSDEAATVTSPSPSTATEQGNGAPPISSRPAGGGRPGANETEEDTVKTGVSARTAAQPCPSSRSSSGLPPRHSTRVSSSAEKKKAGKGRSDTSESDATTVGASGGGAVAIPAAATATATDPPSAAKSAAAAEDNTGNGVAKVAAIAAGEDDAEAARHFKKEKAPSVSPNLARKKDDEKAEDGNGAAAAAELPKARADSIGSNGNNKKEPSSAKKAAANAVVSAPSAPSQQSLLSYLKHDLLNIDSRQQDGSATEDVDEHMEEFLLVPSKLERLLFFGLAICTDSFLYLLTLLPLKFLWGCVCFVCTVLRPRRPIWGCRFHRRHLYQILQVVVIYTVYSKVLCPISIGRLYHWIRGQAMIKLYVLIAIVEVFDRLMCSFGQDALDSLYWNTTRRPRHPRMLVSTFVVFAYASMHSMILLVHAATLNVAMNSADQALLTLLVSGNFAEIKSTVFKKYNKQNLFKITTSDICERFKLALFLSLTLLLNCFQGGMDSAMIKNYVHMCGIVLVAEMLADWIKHSFITKFNFIKSSVYPDYSVILAGDVTGIGHEGVNLDHTHAVVKRVGLAQIPLVCVMARYLREAARYAMLDKGEDSQTWAVLATYYMKERWGVMFAISLLFFMLLLAMKIMLGFAINGAARRILDDPTVGDHEEHKKSKKAEEKPLRRRQVV